MTAAALEVQPEPTLTVEPLLVSGTRIDRRGHRDRHQRLSVGNQAGHTRALRRPAGHVLQKGNRKVALNQVLSQVVEVVRSKGRRFGQPDAYADVTHEFPILEGESVDHDGQLTNRSGTDFWRVGSGFSGDAGRRRLSLLIQSRLPSPAGTIQL